MSAPNKRIDAKTAWVQKDPANGAGHAKVWDARALQKAYPLHGKPPSPEKLREVVTSSCVYPEMDPKGIYLSVKSA